MLASPCFTPIVTPLGDNRGGGTPPSQPMPLDVTKLLGGLPIPTTVTTNYKVDLVQKLDVKKFKIDKTFYINFFVNIVVLLL